MGRRERNDPWHGGRGLFVVGAGARGGERAGAWECATFSQARGGVCVRGGEPCAACAGRGFALHRALRRPLHRALHGLASAGGNAGRAIRAWDFHFRCFPTWAACIHMCPFACACPQMEAWGEAWRRGRRADQRSSGGRGQIDLANLNTRILRRQAARTVFFSTTNSECGCPKSEMKRRREPTARGRGYTGRPSATRRALSTLSSRSITESRSLISASLGVVYQVHAADPVERGIAATEARERQHLSTMKVLCFKCDCAAKRSALTT